MAGRRWLLVGAMGVETGPLLARLADRQLVAPRTFAGVLGGVQVAITTCGVGPAAARRATAGALAGFPAEAVLSLGTAGALVDEHRRGDLLTVARVLRGGAPHAELAPLPGLPVATVSTVARPVWTADRRAALAAAGAHLVEMELASVVDAARAHHPALPVQALKVVSDAAGRGRDGVAPAPRLDRIARFQLRALRLAETRLVPAVLGALAHGG